MKKVHEHTVNQQAIVVQVAGAPVENPEEICDGGGYETRQIEG